MKTNHIESSIGSVISDAGYELVDMEFRKSRESSVLQIFVDGEDGVNFEALTLLSSLIGEVLESKDLVKGTYSLEVSSPGVERPLKKIRDYIRFKGKLVRLNLFKPISGSKSILVTILDIEKDVIIFEDEAKNRISLGLSEVAKANLYFDFNNK